MRTKVLIVILLFGVFVSCTGKKESETAKNRSTEIIARFENGNMKTVKVFQEIDGKQIWVSEIHYHPNGSKSMEGTIKNGLREGEWISWYEDGKIWSKGNFKNGNRDGMGYVYFPSGKIQIEGPYIDGKRTGLWRSYDDQGNLISDTDYTSTK
jgi:antitoxin component YwqK of YwqJK toxin-antitoxin module